MRGAGDFAGIGVPFAAGVAAGALLFAPGFRSPVLLPAVASILLFLLTGYSFLRFDNGTRTVTVRVTFGILFLLTGAFCSLNSALAAGIPVPEGPLSRLAGMCEKKLCCTIDNVPYPSGTTGPLVKALLTGDRGGLDRTTVGIFRDSGASHILALSGLHLGVIYLILSRLTRPLGNGPRARKARYSLILGASGFYALMTGASPSIVRAFLFILLGETASLLGREKDPARVLLAALTVQLALDPGVVSSTGFQLSYLAMTGIAFVYPALERLYPDDWGRWDPFRKVWQAAVLSISCQVFTAPLVWLRFRTFPKYFLMTNLTALPLTSAVMVLSVVTTALSFTGNCPYFLVMLDDRAVQLLLRCLEVISSM